MNNHIEGNENSYSGTYNHLEGRQHQGNGDGNHIEGKKNSCYGTDCHVEGVENGVGSGTCNHVCGTKNDCRYGNYNERNANAAFIVGGGNADETDENGNSIVVRKNIYTLDWQGNAIFAGDVTNAAGVSLNGLKSDIDNIEVIAEGGAIAKVFDTKADLDTWLTVAGNTETLVVGQNIYIVEKGTPDYWWDGTGLQALETDKVEIESMTYDETMTVLNATAEEVT